MKTDTISIVLGGTFDPIHNGHMFIANSLCATFPRGQVIFVPNQVPPHKPSPSLSAETRCHMLRLAIENNKQLSLDTLELQRTGPSYTVDTIRQLRNNLGDSKPLAFVVGMDAFLDIESWHQPVQLMKLCHFIIYPRDNKPSSKQLTKLQKLAKALTGDAKNVTIVPEELLLSPAGKLFIAQDVPPHISSTEIRAKIVQNQALEGQLPQKVADYIKQNSLYRL